jgi:hypothetical protein
MPTFYVVADSHQFYLLDEAISAPYPEHITDVDLIRGFNAVPFLVAVYTSSDETVEVQVERADRAPELDIADWLHVFECPLQLPSGCLVIAGPSSFLPGSPRLHVPPGSYRARVSGRGFGEGAREEYLVSLWPSSDVGATVIKSGNASAG